MRLIILTILCVVFLHIVKAQSDSTSNEGEIITGEIVIEKDNQIILPHADKIFTRTTPLSLGDQPVNVNFLNNAPTFEWPDYKSDVPFQLINQSYPEEPYQNYVLAGFGNYTSPLIEAGLFYTFGNLESQAKVFYESFNGGPVNGENSSSSIGGVAISGVYKAESIQIKPSISYHNSQYSFYGNSDRVNTGYDAAADEDVSLNQFKLKLELTGGSGDMKYSITPMVSVTNQNLVGTSGLNKESVLGMTGSLNYKIDDSFETGFDIEGNVGAYDGGLQVDRSLINISPWVNYKKDQWSIMGGFMVSSGKVDTESKTGFYPKAKVEYILTDKWSVYGLISGGLKWNSLNSLISENQFLDDSLAIIHSENSLQIGGGLKGSPLKNVLLEASLMYRSVEGLPFYVPSSSDSSRYVLAYDNESVGVVTLKSSLSYMPTSVSTYGASLEINGYSMGSLDRPWHRPAYVFKVFTSHNIHEKLIVSAFLTSMGGVRGPANVDFGYVRLAAFSDLGVSAKYLITPRASAFIQVNNLLNSEYERYLGYPTRGITFKLGGQYRF